MKAPAKFLIVIIALLVIVAGGAIYLLGSLDAIVKAAIEEHGSRVTQTRVGVSGVKIVLTEGKGSISGITVGNPKGFAQSNAFKLGNISTAIDTNTVTQSPVVIKDVTISGPEIFYEINKDGNSNFDALKKNVAASTGGGQSSDKGEEVKVIINRLVIEGGKVAATIAALGDKKLETSLPRIVLTDIGKKEGGATGAEVAKQVADAVISKTKTAVTELGVNKYLGKAQEEVQKQLEGAVGEPVKGLTDTLKDSGGEGLKKIFQ
jgi:uncharacterized protein involved in outer membrane biogenesis